MRGEKFLRALEGVTDPERKRKTIGALFIDIFEARAAEIGGADFLAQGTLYPDVIESLSAAAGNSVTIKSHHNVGGLPERMRMRLVERPLAAQHEVDLERLIQEIEVVHARGELCLHAGHACAAAGCG